MCPWSRPRIWLGLGLAIWSWPRFRVGGRPGVGPPDLISAVMTLASLLSELLDVIALKMERPKCCVNDSFASSGSNSYAC